MTDDYGHDGSLLNSTQRAADWLALSADEFDLVVVGGGVTGAGAALDASSRGLRVALIESCDLASGTSSKSSKLIHGGLRYLEMLNFGLVREALRERNRLLTTLAPHLVKPINFIWPLTHVGWERLYLGAGLALYDTMGGAGALPWHRHLSKRTMKRIAPGLDPAAYTGGMHFYDAIEDDARMVMMIARTAKAWGARVLTGARAEEITRVGGRVSTIRVVDVETGDVVDVRTRHISYAAGVWSDELRKDGPRVRPSKGVHILVPKQAIDSRAGILMRTEKSVLFVIPWGAHWLIGDTDTDWPLDRAKPVASGADLDYILEKVNRVLSKNLTRADIVGSFTGLRPLVQSDPMADTTKLSREHTVVKPEQDVTMIAGGKYTTYRVMAEDLVNAAVEASGIDADPSRTKRLPLVGADDYERARTDAVVTAQSMGVSEATIQHLLGRYGDRVRDLADLIRRSPELARTIDGYAPYIWAEIEYAYSHEGARSVEDVLERRTRIRIQYRDSGRTILPVVARVGATALGWDTVRVEAEISAYSRSIDAEDAALTMASDADALVAYRRLDP